MFRLVQQHGQPQRPRLAFAKSSQQKFLRHPALQDGVHQQHVSALYVGPTTEGYLSTHATFLLHVANVLADKMANRWRIDLPYQVCPKYKPAIQRNHHIQPFSRGRS
jgi:hypothetical protein